MTTRQMGLGYPWKGHLTPGWRQLSSHGWVYAALGMGGPKPSVKYMDVRQSSFPSVSAMSDRLISAGAAFFGSGRMQ